MGLAPTGVLRVPPIPHCNWRTLPSSQPPSLPALSFPLAPTPLGSFGKAPGGGGPSWWGGRGPRAKRGGRGGGSKRHLGLDPPLGALDIFRKDKNPVKKKSGTTLQILISWTAPGEKLQLQPSSSWLPKEAQHQSLHASNSLPQEFEAI